MELIWLGGALAGGLLAIRAHMPVFVGYLVVGLIFGLAGQAPSELLLEAGHIGVLLLLFGIGLHLRPRHLFSGPVLVGGGVHLLLSIALFYFVASSLGVADGEALIWGVLLSFSSTVLAAKTLESSGELGAFHGRLAIGILVLQDVIAVAVMVAVSDSAPSAWVLIVVPGMLLLRWPLMQILSAVESEELQLLIAVIWVLGVATVFEMVRFSPELGAIAAGALIAAHPRGSALAERLWGLKELLLVGFFLSVGMQVSPGMEDWGIAFVFALLLPYKAWLFFALLVALGLRARTAFLTGGTLTSYSEFTLIAGVVAEANGMLSMAGLSMLTLATVISFVLHLPVNRLSHALFDRLHKILRRFERNLHHPDDPVASIGAAHYLVLGMGRTGTAAYDFLRREGRAVAGLDTEPEILSRHRRVERRVAYGDAQDRDLWRYLRLDAVRGAVVALPHAAGRERAVRLLRDYAPHIVISTYAMHAHEADTLRGIGADNVSYLLAEAGERMAELSCVPPAAETKRAVPEPERSL